MRRHPGDAEDGFEASRTLGGIRHGKLEGVFQGLGDGQLRLGRGELRGEPNLTDEVLGTGDALAGETGFAGLRQDAENRLH